MTSNSTIRRRKKVAAIRETRIVDGWAAFRVAEDKARLAYQAAVNEAFAAYEKVAFGGRGGK
jgi:hypothetical protein